jgi:Zn-dependent protease with chaperone function
MPPRRATPDFHAAQAAARRRSALLVPLVVAAFAATALLVHAGVLVATSGWFGRATGFLDPQVLVPVAGLVALLAACGAGPTVARIVDQGGDAVALLLGGTLADRGDGDPGTARLLNVVEEMAIAAGLPVPRVYVLRREPGLNALAAGLSPDRAVIAVTRGAVDALTRDELQGVVAHELSHVLNGDVRLGTQLVAAVAGLDAVASAGRWLLGAGRIDTVRGVRRRALPSSLGLLLVVAGGVGALFARLVQCAVSRQRELLADAAAVQFTRDPDALAGALRKIAVQGGAVASAHRAEASHLLFADGGGLLSGLLATHPPIEERIRRIAPHGASVRPGARSAPSPVEHAGEVLAGLPPALAAAAHDGPLAPAVIAALLVDGRPAVRERQLAALAQRPGTAEVPRLAALASGLSPEARGAVLALALPGLDGLDRGAATALLDDLATLAAADGRATAFEWAVGRVVHRRVAAALGERRPARRARRAEDVAVECLEVLSALAWHGADDEAAAQAALEAGARALGASGWRILARDRVDRARLDAALAALDAASPEVKARIVAACAACAAADGRIAEREREAVRAIAAAIGWAMPLLGGASAATVASVA